MKYVVIDTGGLEHPIIFDESMNHGSVVKGPVTVISAGFCSFSPAENTGPTNLKVNCWGHSLSLGVKSRLEIDEALILRSLEFRI